MCVNASETPLSGFKNYVSMCLKINLNTHKNGFKLKK
jgi:hypothetical protein